MDERTGGRETTVIRRVAAGLPVRPLETLDGRALLEDLVSLCRDLNRERARYVVTGGMAIIQSGFGRATNDIDLLIDTSPENRQRVRRALMGLPDQAVRDMADDDLERYAVVRVADEIVVDLMRSACGIAYSEASGMITEVEIELLRPTRPGR